MLRLVRQNWPLLGLGLLVNTAYSTMWPLTTLYLHHNLHLSLIVSGWILAVYSIGNVLGGYLGGVLADRYAIKRVGQGLLSGLLLDALLGTFWHDVWGYPVVLVIFGVLTGGMLTLITTLAAQLSRQESRLFNFLYIFINLGLVVGTASIGILYRQNILPIFVLLLGCYGAALGVWQKTITQLLARVSHQAVSTAPQTPRLRHRRLTRVSLVTLLVSLVLMWGTYAQWMSNVSIYIQELGLGIQVYSHLWVYNGVLLIIVQGVMTKVSRVKGLPWQVLGGLLAISGSFLLLSTVQHLGGLVMAMTLLTIGEAVYVPGVPALINAYTVGREGKYQGMVNAFSSLGKALGPVAGGWLIERSAGYSGLFMLCAGVNAIVVLGVLVGSWTLLHRTV